MLRVLRSLESRTAFVLCGMLFRSSLEIAYVLFVNPLYEYRGFTLEVDPVKYLESWSLYLVCLVVLPRVFQRASDFFMALLLFSVLTPLLTLYGLSGASRNHLYIVLGGVALIELFRRGPPLKLPLIRGSRAIALGLLIFGALGVSAWMVASGGLRFFNLDLRQVYEFREQSGSVINQGVMAYVNTWATKVFGPLLLAVFLWRKRLLLAAAVVGLHVLWFGITAHKAVLFYPMLTIFLWFWFRNTRALSLLSIGMLIAVSGSLAAYLLLDHILTASLFIRRVFFVPSSLTFAYYEFFSENDRIFWTNSLLSWYSVYPYDVNPAELIGRYLGTESHANNSFLATGYMHGGAVGTGVYCVLVGLIFRLIDSLANKGVPSWVAVSALIVPTRSLLVSADLPTALLTHGIGIAVLFLLLLRSSRDTIPVLSQNLRDVTSSQFAPGVSVNHRS